jgi:hypothetical protein
MKKKKNDEETRKPGIYEFETPCAKAIVFPP